VFGTRSEHRAESRSDDVEALVLERKRFGIGFPPFHVEFLCLGALPPLNDELRSDVRSDDARPFSSRGHCHVPVTRGNVQDAHARLDPGSLDDRFGRRPQDLRDLRVMSLRPHELHPVFDL
jgi:hypothetical protein